MQIALGYTETPLGRRANHALVIMNYKATGRQYATRAGPSSGFGSSASSRSSGSSSSGGSFSASGGEGSSGGFGFGYIKPEYGPFDANFRDAPSQVYISQDVGVVNRPFADLVSNAQEFARVTEANPIPYWPLGPNSNSYAFTFVESLRFNRPQLVVNASGWDMGPPNASLSY